jgi:hypothetical protein
MTNRVELNYILKNEPNDFIHIQKQFNRHVYIWKDLKICLEDNGDLNSWIRTSEMLNEPVHGFMEVWSSFDTIIPTKIDNQWVEKYKLITNQSFNIEWHPELSLLRIIWYQNKDTLKINKILATVMKYLTNNNLAMPVFPFIYEKMAINI